jgi:hypothetical protein
MSNPFAENLLKEIDVVAEQVKVFKGAAHQFVELHRQMGSTLDRLTESLRLMQQSTFVNRNAAVMDKVSQLESSIENLVRARNTMDGGTFVVRCDRTMDAVWETLP